MEYLLIEEYSKEKLVAKVNEMIASGWRPLGGISIAQVAVRVCYLQAMTKG
jgi:hypothetical protein